MARCTVLLLLLLTTDPLLLVVPAPGASGTIVFTTLGRSRYAFDIFVLPLLLPPLTVIVDPSTELRLTDGASVNYNGHRGVHGLAPLRI
jgi:hypothetical protein